MFSNKKTKYQSHATVPIKNVKAHRKIQNVWFARLDSVKNNCTWCPICNKTKTV